MTETNTSIRTLDALVIGAGFAGLYMLHKLRLSGLSVQVVEAGDDIGGTWYWNRYPGARCDVESVDYSYSFDSEIQQEWVWKERYAAQPEILDYIHFVADRLDLRRDIQLGTRIKAATYDEARNRWVVTSETGEQWDCAYLILGTGVLSAPKLPPDIAGIGDFGGETLYTSRWPDDADLTGKRVAVFGTGSSGIQVIPLLAEQAEHLYVLQRTPAFSVPARNRPLEPGFLDEYKKNYDALRAKARNSWQGVRFHSTGKKAFEVGEEERRAAYEERWSNNGFHMPATFTDILTDRAANDTVAEFCRDKIRETVKDPVVAESLCPHDYPLGAKRICLDTNYFETYNRDNVTLVDLRKEAFLRITAEGVQTADRTIPLDAIVFATGFDAMTGAVLRISITGVGGQTIQEKWAAGPQTYLGVSVSGFPNMFILAGPGSPSVFTNMVMGIEQQVEWVARAIEDLRAGGYARLEAREQAEADWVRNVNDLVAHTLFNEAASWYLGANVPGKPRVFMPYFGGLNTYTAICNRIADNGYEGFARA